MKSTTEMMPTMPFSNSNIPPLTLPKRHHQQKTMDHNNNFWYFGGGWLMLGLVVLFQLQGGFEGGEEGKGEKREEGKGEKREEGKEGGG